MSIGLSKSKYCRGMQCHKILWLDTHMPEQAANLGLEAVMATGLKVGELARNYFSPCSLVEFSDDKTFMAYKTKHLMDNNTENIAEASFIYDGLYCAVDILHRNGDGFDIVKVKSSTSVKDIYIDDIAFQYYLLTQCEVNVKKLQLMYINKSYERHGNLELDKLFVLEDYTKKAIEKTADVERNIAEIRGHIEVRNRIK